jgi:hypothetical protein
MAETEASWKGEELLGREDKGARKWEKPLESSGALKEDEV